MNYLLMSYMHERPAHCCPSQRVSTDSTQSRRIGLCCGTHGAIFLEGWGWDRHSEAQSRSQAGGSTGELLYNSEESTGVEPDLYIAPWEISLVGGPSYRLP